MSFLEEEKSSPISFTLLIAVFALVALLGGASWLVIIQKNFDEETLCELNTENLMTVILFDKTGGFSENQERMISQIIQKEMNVLTSGERLAVYGIDPKGMNGLSEPFFDKCKPRDGSEADALFENAILMKNKFNEQFSSVLEEVAEGQIQAEGAQTSPLIESLQDLVTIATLNDAVKLNKIVMISDLLQHSQNISFYNFNLQEFKKEDLLPLVPDLLGVNVQLYWLLRDGNERAIQNVNLIPWWEHFFEYAGISNLNVTKVR